MATPVSACACICKCAYVRVHVYLDTSEEKDKPSILCIDSVASSLTDWLLSGYLLQTCMVKKLAQPKIP